jgi:hypothetical protein
MTDVFDLLGDLDPFGRFEYTPEQWAHNRAVIMERLGCEADAISIKIEDAAVALRTHLEVEIGLYRFKTEFTNRYPLQTAKQILPRLEHVQRLLLELHRSLKTPEVALYAFDWSDGGPKNSILFVENQLRQVGARVTWLSRLFPNEPYPGPAAPSDVAPAEGCQTHHRRLADDPEGDLVAGLLSIYERAFQRKAAITEGGPAFHFLRAVVRPVFGDLTDGRVRYCLRRTLGR